MTKKTRKQTMGNYICEKCGRKDTKLLAHSVHMSRKHGIIRALNRKEPKIQSVNGDPFTRLSELMDDLVTLGEEAKLAIANIRLNLNGIKEKAEAFDKLRQIMSITVPSDKEKRLAKLMER